jgi:hypothetical protein
VCGVLGATAQSSQNFYSKKSSLEIVDFLGVQAADSLSKTRKRRWGGGAPHLRAWVSGRETAVTPPEIGDFRGRLLKIKVFGTLGAGCANGDP